MDYHESRRRSIAKAISWRILATALALGTTWSFTDRFAFSLEITLTGAVIGTIAYYLHERVWNRSSWGREIRP